MERDDLKNKLRKAIDRHLAEHGGVTAIINPNGLIAGICEELGFADETMYNGWTIRRVYGADIPGTSRGSKGRYGYIASKPGRDDHVAQPSGGMDVPLDYFKTNLDQMDRLTEKYGRLEIE